MDNISKISAKIRNLFGNDEVTAINAKDLILIPLNEWQYINDGAIRYKIVEHGEGYSVSITEWMQDATFKKHFHADANEVIFIICGWLEGTMDGLKRYAFQKLFFSAGTIHEVRAKKGTKICVRFDYI